MGEGIAVAIRTFAEMAVGFRRAGINGVLVPILPAIEVAVGFACETAEALGEAQFIAADEGVNPVGGKVVIAVLRIEQAED